MRRIAPRAPHGRDRELAALAAFVTADDGGCPYSWLRAKTWVGKSALMSWLVLHPPAGVRVVSFFVIARYAGHADRKAFTDVVIEQLAKLLGEPLPALPQHSHRHHRPGAAAVGTEHRGGSGCSAIDGAETFARSLTDSEDEIGGVFQLDLLECVSHGEFGPVSCSSSVWRRRWRGKKGQTGCAKRLNKARRYLRNSRFKKFVNELNGRYSIFGLAIGRAEGVSRLRSNGFVERVGMIGTRIAFVAALMG